MINIFDPRTTSLIGIILVILASACFAQEPKIGDVADGSRSRPVHLIDLYDEEGALISPSDRIPMPFSTKQTCLKCHEYSKISGGWHFNAADPDVSPGRRGEPWILTDPVSGTQVPLSYRNWPGTKNPESFGLTPFHFTEKFGRHHTGGGISENDSTESLDIYLRWMVSGKAEINCLGCHDAERAHDQAEYDLQISKQNYRWAVAATSGFATVTGSARIMPDNYDIYSGAIPDIKDAVPPSVRYDKNRFDNSGKVLFDVIREAPKERCYFCHSAKTIGSDKVERWETDEDVHLTAGMTCVDCHRNGINHNMTRGYEWEADLTGNRPAASLSCAGCHIRDDDAATPQSGRLGAPYPRHRSIPVIHFEKLSCTACHSGSWPEANAQKVKLSRTHGLGTYSAKRGDEVAPYIFSPVYVKDDDGKIAPHRLMWPSYWAYMDGGNVNPVQPEIIRPVCLAIILSDSLTDSTNVAGIIAGKWPKFTEIQIIQILDSLKTIDPVAGIPVYIGGGKLFMVESAALTGREHPAAEPYTWAFAHDVRPAEQSLGIRGCDDCHSINAPFVFGSVTASIPGDFASGVTISMNSMQGIGSIYPGQFAVSFLFRPFLKYLIILCCIIISLVLLLYTLKGLEAVLKKWSGTNS